MAGKTKLTETAVKIGTALGRADRTARTVGKAAQVAREELVRLTKEIEALGKELKIARQRLKDALR